MSAPKIKITPFAWGIIALALAYLILRLINLTIIPIFADEAIYLRWAQLIIEDPGRYFFFPLNDGKTPLQIWLMVPLLELFSDPLIAGRLLSVFFGLGQLLLMIKVAALFTPKKSYQLLVGLLTLFTPGLIFLSRFALLDTQLTFFLTLSFYFTYLALAKIAPLTKFSLRSYFSAPAIFAGLSFGLALLTKFSAIMFLPVLATMLFYFWPANFRWQKKSLLALTRLALSLALIAGLGLIILAFLLVSPAFPQLFARGSDFLFPLSEFFSRPLEIIWRNLQIITPMLSSYLTSILFYFSLIFSIFFWPKSKTPAFLIISGLAFILPILLLGDVIHARYLLPSLPFFILSFALSLSLFTAHFGRLLRFIFLAFFFALGLFFTWANLLSPISMNLFRGDLYQYFGDWSSGHGVNQTIDLIEELRQNQPLLVLTEGTFGTLPDALLLHYFGQDLGGTLQIDGIGQPVHNWDQYQDQVDSFPQAILVVNSHRLEKDLPAENLLLEVRRPLPDAPSLQVWDIKNLPE